MAPSTPPLLESKRPGLHLQSVKFDEPAGLPESEGHTWHCVSLKAPSKALCVFAGHACNIWPVQSAEQEARASACRALGDGKWGGGAGRDSLRAARGESAQWPLGQTTHAPTTPSAWLS